MLKWKGRFFDSQCIRILYAFVPLNAGVATYFVDHLLNLGLSKISVAYFFRLCMKHRGDLLTVDIVDDLEWYLKVISGTTWPVRDS